MMCRGGSQTNAGVMEELSPTLTETTSRRSKQMLDALDSAIKLVREQEA